MELTFFRFGVELVFSEDLQDLANMVDAKSGIFGVDDDVVKDADCRNIQVLAQYIIHKMLEHCRSVSKALRTHFIFKMTFPTPESCFILITLLDPYLMICIAQIHLRKDFSGV